MENHDDIRYTKETVITHKFDKELNLSDVLKDIDQITFEEKLAAKPYRAIQLITINPQTGVATINVRENEEHEGWWVKKDRYPTADRSHEECAECAYEEVEPPQCEGHCAGPVHCHKFKSKK